MKTKNENRTSYDIVRNVAIVATIVFYVLAALIVTVLVLRSPTDTYTVEATIIEKDLIKTSDGNLWCADTNNKMIGGTASVTFNNNGTPENIYDDIIIRIN